MNKFTLNLTSKVILPDLDYINELAEEKGFKFGRNFAETPTILEDLFFLFQQEHKDPLGFDAKKFLFSSEYIESDIIFGTMTDSQLAYYNYTLVFLSKIEYDSVLGITPLDKSLNVLLYLTHLSNKTNPNNSQHGVSNPNPGGLTIEDEEALAEAIKEMSEGVDSNTPGRNNNQQGLKKEMTKCIRDHLGDLSVEIAHIYGKNRPADVPINKEILNDIRVKAYLENTKGLSTSLESENKKNNDSEKRDNFHMENYDQIAKVSKTKMAMPNFDDKFIKKELIVKEKVKPEEKKQILYMLLDDSGSMTNETKQTYVRAVLLNRLEAVVKGNAELKFCLYESKRYNFMDIVDKKGAKKAFNMVSLRVPGGGGTNIGRVIQETIDEICKLEDYHDPEIMIVCDGDDKLHVEEVDLKGVKVNAVLLGRKNPDIEKLTKLSGGFYTVEALYR